MGVGLNQLQVNVMMNVEQLIVAIQDKITHYRDVQQSAWRVKGCMRVGRQDLAKAGAVLKADVTKQLGYLQKETLSSVLAICHFYEDQINKQKGIYEQQIYELSNEIARQHQVITFLKKDLEDLMMMLNLREEQKYDDSREEAEERSRETEQQEVQHQSADRAQTINGLEVIEEEETDRTLLSSARSGPEDQTSRHNQNFIRIESGGEEDENDHFFSKKQFGELQIAVQKPDNADGQIEIHFKSLQKSHSNDDCYSDERSNFAKFDHMMDSNLSKLQNPSLFDLTANDNYGQYESIPVDGISATNQFSREQLGLWQSKFNSKQLKDISNSCNESEQERQSKTKMFLQQFRKTFTKCLSSEIPRKFSSKTNPSSKKSTSRQDKSRKGTTREATVNPNAAKADSERSDSHKLINEMLRDIDNNNKFSVGNRKTELRYQGEKRDNLRAGQGTLYYSNGLCYQGEFKNNLRHGSGVLRFNQIDIYKGEWVGDELSGRGKIRNFAVINKKKSQANNSPLLKWVSYFGFFKNNRFEGQGTLYLQGGQKFLGKFICGMACGQGTLYKKNGEVENGIWRNNQVVEQF